MKTVTAKKNKFANNKKLLTGQGALNEIKDEFYWTLFRKLKSRAQTGLTRQITAPTKNGHAPPY